MIAPEHVFRAYDVRGVVYQDLTVDFSRGLGRAVGTMAVGEGRRTLSVGRDCRTHSGELTSAFIDGILSTGVDVVDLGVVPTPLVYFSLFHLADEVDGGVMVTGSHNPKEYNGFKICMGQSSIHGESIQILRRLMEEETFETGEGRCRQRLIVRDYIDYVKGNLQLSTRAMGRPGR